MFRESVHSDGRMRVHGPSTLQENHPPRRTTSLTRNVGLPFLPSCPIPLLVHFSSERCPSRGAAFADLDPPPRDRLNSNLLL